jgi:hypothetical protein
VLDWKTDIGRIMICKPVDASLIQRDAARESSKEGVSLKNELPGKLW